jgi:hypothetical protein
MLRNLIAYALLVGVLVAVHYVIAADPNAVRSAAQAAVFSWPWLIGVSLAGLIGVVLLSRTPLPGLWDPDIGLGEKLFAPILAGLVLGAAEVVTDGVTGWGALMARQMHLSSIHIAWPLSAPIYGGGAILVSIIYFLVLIPLGVWALCVKAFKGKGLDPIYWVIGVLCALIEPVSQGEFGEIASHGAPAAIFAGEDLAMNLTQVWFMRHAGFIAAVLARVAFYAVWHVGWGWFQTR